MKIPPRLRKFLLTTHIVTAVGWLGAVVAYLPLDVIATTGQDQQAVRAAFFAMDAMLLWCIVPLALVSVLIGIANALISPWGLFRHYWVIVKLVLTLFATAILLKEAQSVAFMAEVAASGADPRNLPGSLPHSIGGFVVLLIITIFSVYKPRGVTPYGWRMQQRPSVDAPAAP